MVIFYWSEKSICQAEPISSLDLINNVKKYDGQTVEYSGEVIGDIMSRGQYAWVNVNDSKNAIGIWVKKELTNDIIFTGSYKAKGDRVEVRSVFNRSCPEHGGDFDIHAQSFIKIDNGNNISHPLGKKTIILAGGLFLGLFLVLILKKL
jgi:hypothetical protein